MEKKYPSCLMLLVLDELLQLTLCFSFKKFVPFDNILQTERAYQKQAPIFQNKKRVLGQPGKKKELRYVRNVGLGFKTPKEVSSVYLWVHGSHYSSDLLPINRKSYCRGRFFFFSGFFIVFSGVTKCLRFKIFLWSDSE